MKTKILLIQSAETYGNGAKQVLEGRGYKVVWAASGLSALMLARNVAIDIILLDVALPDIEGLDLCRLFRKRPETHNVPILLLTARGYRPQQTPGGTEGPDDYLEKPYADIDLDKKIAAVLAPKETAAALQRDAAKYAASTLNPIPALITVTQEALKPGLDQIHHSAPEKPASQEDHPAEAQPEAVCKPAVPEPQPVPAASADVPLAHHEAAEPAATDTGEPGRVAGSSDDDGPAPAHTLLPFHGTGDTVVDQDTGLYGRAQFEAMLEKEFKRAIRFKQPMSIMLIDLDGRIRGQTADETLVKAIISLVQKTIREVDTAAWWSGESFIVLLPNTSATDALQAAARTREAVATHPFSWPDATRVTMNIGVAGLPSPIITTREELLASAYAAMHRAQDLMTPPSFDIRSLRK